MISRTGAMLAIIGLLTFFSADFIQAPSVLSAGFNQSNYEQLMNMVQQGGKYAGQEMMDLVGKSQLDAMVSFADVSSLNSMKPLIKNAGLIMLFIGTILVVNSYLLHFKWKTVSKEAPYKRQYYGRLKEPLKASAVGYFLSRVDKGRISELLVCLLDEKSGNLKTLSRILLDEEQSGKMIKILAELRTKAKPGNVDSKIKPDYWLKKEVIVTVDADDIAESKVHTSGFTLINPRVIKVK